MPLRWKITQQDIDCVNALLDKHVCNGMIWRRVANNLAEHKEEITKERFWQDLASMRLTTQQRSSPGSSVYRFNEENPYPLAYDILLQQQDIERFVSQTLQEYGGIRHINNIGRDLSKNFHALNEEGAWKELLEQVNQLTTLQSKETEREIARYLAKYLSGIGPKQSRNVLQSLGLTRYEIPIDSRVIKWLRGNTTFPAEELNEGNLSSTLGYEIILDEIQNFCEVCNEFPCIVDAVVFSDPDGDRWGIVPNAKRNWPRPN